MNDLYLVYVIDKDGYIKGEKRVTDNKHLSECVRSIKHDFNVPLVHYNKAVFCFDGYLVQGDYLGTI